MKNEKFYTLTLGEENEKQLVSNETFEKLFSKEDTRVHINGYSRIFVASEHKTEVEKEYDIELVSFRKDFTERMFDYDQIGEMVYEIAEADTLLSFWKDKSFNEMTCKIIIRDTLNDIYSLPNDEAMKRITEEYSGYRDFMWSMIEKMMWKVVLDKVKAKYKELA